MRCRSHSGGSREIAKLGTQLDMPGYSPGRHKLQQFPFNRKIELESCLGYITELGTRSSLALSYSEGNTRI